MSLDCSLENVHSRRTASQEYTGLLLTECTFAKDSVSGVLFQVCKFGKAAVSGLLLTECTFAKDRVSGLLFQVYIFGKELSLDYSLQNVHSRRTASQEYSGLLQIPQLDQID